MRYRLFAYDIKNNSIRSKVARILEQRGKRIQKSVFMLYISDNEYIKIEMRIMDLIKEDDSLLSIPLCSNCLEHSKIIDNDPKIMMVA